MLHPGERLICVIVMCWECVNLSSSHRIKMFRPAWSGVTFGFRQRQARVYCSCSVKLSTSDSSLFKCYVLYKVHNALRSDEYVNIKWMDLESVWQVNKMSEARVWDRFTQPACGAAPINRSNRVRGSEQLLSLFLSARGAESPCSACWPGNCSLHFACLTSFQDPKSFFHITLLHIYTCINAPLFVFCLESDRLIGDLPGLRLVPRNPVQSILAHSSPVQSGGSWEGSDFN